MKTTGFVSQSQRDCASQPRVAELARLPWENGCHLVYNPRRVVATHSAVGTTSLGLSESFHYTPRVAPKAQPRAGGQNPFGIHAAGLTNLVVLFVIAVLVGCRPRTDEAEHAHESEAGVTFNEKKGLLVSPETAKFIGLQLADVEERKISAAFHFSAQIYRAASEAKFASLPPTGTSVAVASGTINATDATKLSEGQTVSVRTAQGDTTLSARVVTLTRHLEEASGHVEVTLAVSDAPQPLAVGAFLSVSVAHGGEKTVASVPRSALFRTAEGDFVYTVSGEHFVRTPVKRGVADDEFVEIIDGLYAGDQIVVQPVMSLWLTELQSLRGGKACADGH